MISYLVYKRIIYTNHVCQLAIQQNFSLQVLVIFFKPSDKYHLSGLKIA